MLLEFWRIETISLTVHTVVTLQLRGIEAVSVTVGTFNVAGILAD